MHSPTQIFISIIIPVYRSYDSLKTLIGQLRDILNSQDYQYEIIMVDDSGTGFTKSWDLILSLTETDPEHLRGIRLSSNQGQHRASLCGMSKACGQIILTIDDDLEYSPAYIPDFVSSFISSGADIAYGIETEENLRVRIKNNLFRIIKSFSRLPYKPQEKGSSFRLLNKSLADKLCNYVSENRKGVYTFIDIIVLEFTDNFTYFPVSRSKRRKGHSGYSLLSVLHILAFMMIFYTGFPLLWLLRGFILLSLSMIFYFSILPVVTGSDPILLAIWGSLLLLLSNIPALSILFAYRRISKRTNPDLISIIESQAP